MEAKERDYRLRQQLIELAGRLLAKGLVVRTWGNFSLKVDDTALLITPSGRAYDTMAPEDLVSVSLETKKALPDQPLKPSSEAPMHALVYLNRPKARVVLHTHQVYASALSLSPRELTVGQAHQAILGTVSIPVAGYGLPGTKGLHQHIEAALRSSTSDVVLMARHGALIIAEDIDQAIERAEALEEVCRAAYEKLIGRDGGVRDDLSYDNVLETALRDRRQVAYPAETLIVSTDDEVKQLPEGALKPYLDDFAQIVGVSVSHKRRGNQAVFGPDKAYTLCFGQDEQEARSVRAVLEKNARAAQVARIYRQNPIPAWECRLMRLVYHKKYSAMAGAK